MKDPNAMIRSLNFVLLLIILSRFWDADNNGSYGLFSLGKKVQ